MTFDAGAPQPSIMEREATGGIACERDGAIAIVRLEREAKCNTIDNVLIESLRKVLIDLRDDPEVRVVILTGSGSEAFSSGMDLEYLGVLSQDEAISLAACVVETAALIENLGKPVIAAVNGEAIGAGCELALACHLRLASADASFAASELGVGATPILGFSSRLSSLIGRPRALELILTGVKLTAMEAEEFGLISRCADALELLPAATALAREMGLGSPLAMKSALEAINRGMTLHSEDALTLEGDLFAECFRTTDMQEGVRAFFEKRSPEFKGR